MIVIISSPLANFQIGESSRNHIQILMFFYFSFKGKIAHSFQRMRGNFWHVRLACNFHMLVVGSLLLPSHSEGGQKLLEWQGFQINNQIVYEFPKR